MQLQWYDKCLQWCLGDEWGEVSKSSQLICSSSSLQTFLRFPITASACSDWSLCGLHISVCSGWICLHQSCVLRRGIQVVSFISTIMLHLPFYNFEKSLSLIYLNWRHSYYQGINTEKLLCRVTKQNLLPYMSAHPYHQHRHLCLTRPSARTYSYLTRPSPWNCTCFTRPLPQQCTCITRPLPQQCSCFTKP